jgi:hypothetical protein
MAFDSSRAAAVYPAGKRPADECGALRLLEGDHVGGGFLHHRVPE